MNEPKENEVITGDMAEKVLDSTKSEEVKNMEQENNESPSVLNKTVGNIEAESSKLAPAQVTIVGVKEETEKSDGSKHKVPLIKFLCKHPEKDEPIAISKIKLIQDEKVITRTTWAPLDKEENIQKGSAIDDVIKFFEVATLADVEGKKVHTVVESKDSSFLCLKLFN